MRTSRVPARGHDKSPRTRRGLGPVTVLGPFEYEVQLLSDANGGYVQWPFGENSR